MVEIVEALHVTAPWLDSGVSLTAVQTVGTVHFTKVLKTDPRIYRLLVGKTRAAESSITIAPIIDTLVELRNDKRSKLLSELAAVKAVDGFWTSTVPRLRASPTCYPKPWRSQPQQSMTPSLGYP